VDEKWPIIDFFFLSIALKFASMDEFQELFGPFSATRGKVLQVDHQRTPVAISQLQW